MKALVSIRLKHVFYLLICLTEENCSIKNDCAQYKNIFSISSGEERPFFLLLMSDKKVKQEKEVKACAFILYFDKKAMQIDLKILPLHTLL